MQLHELRPFHKQKRQKRVGRGGKKGTYSGRGVKGQKARESIRLKPIIRDLIKRYPKLRGIRFQRVQQEETSIIQIQDLEREFQPNELVNPLILEKKRLIHRIKGRTPRVKILGNGSLTKPLIIENCEVSKGAREKIEKAGGIIKLKTQMSKHQRKT